MKMMFKFEPFVLWVRHVQNERKTRRKIKRFCEFSWISPAINALPASLHKSSSFFCSNNLKGFGTKKWAIGYSAANQIIKPNYIPEDFFYLYFEPRINRYYLDQAYTNKAFLYKIFEGVNMPYTHVFCAAGYFYDHHWRPITRKAAIDKTRDCLGEEGKLILKSSINARGGKSVVLLTEDNLDELGMHFKRPDFVVQRYIGQHPALERLNPKSLNTVRVMTLRDRVSTNVIPLSAIVRMGRSHMFVDNQSSGGISSGINVDGSLKSRAFDGFFLRFDDRHPDHGFLFAEQHVPAYDRILELVERLHLQMPYFRLISWDVAVGPDEDLHLVEFNTKYQEINFHQLNNGPLFGDLTEELLADFFQNYM